MFIQLANIYTNADQNQRSEIENSFVNHYDKIWQLVIFIRRLGKIIATLRDEKLIKVGVSIGAIIINNYDFRDMWVENRRRMPRNEGNTFGHDPDLRNRFSNMYERIDFILVRPHADYLGEPILSVAKILGTKRRDKTRTGLWPSDHAGIAAKLKIPLNRYWARK